MHELLTQIIFYTFASLAVLSAVMVVLQTNPVRCTLFLVFTFFASAVLWIMLEAEFLSLILILVYVGAVMTLFLFVVMMLNIDTESTRIHFARYLPFSLVLVALITAFFFYAIPTGSFQMAVEQSIGTASSKSSANRIIFNENTLVEATSALSNTEQIGMVLYTDYIFAFEVAAVLLLVAIVAAITLVHREPFRSKQQSIIRQIMTRREDRVQLIKMQSEK